MARPKQSPTKAPLLADAPSLGADPDSSPPESDPPPRDALDNAIRITLRNPANLRALVLNLLPNLQGKLDFDRLELLDRETIQFNWRGRERDLLVRLPFLDASRSGEVLICILLEHQSREDLLMSLRMVLYFAFYWDQQWRQWLSRKKKGRGRRSPLKLEFIIPIVFHTGERPWSSPRSFTDLFDAPEELQPLAPSWPILYWDLARHSVEELLEAEDAWFPVWAVFRAAREPAGKFQAIVRKAVERIRPPSSPDHSRWYDLMNLLIRLGLRKRPAKERQSLTQLILRNLPESRDQMEVTAMAVTIEREVWEQGRLAGLQEGRQEGRQEGEIAAFHRIIEKHLVRRFGKIPARVRKMIRDTTDLERLETALDHALRAESIDEFSIEDDH